jgi:hypothetical protein
MNTRLITALAFAGWFAAGGGIASAATGAQHGEDAQQETSALERANISLTQAIATADLRTSSPVGKTA